MSLGPEDPTTTQPFQNGNAALSGSALSQGFQLDVTPQGALAATPIVERVKGILTTPILLEALSLIAANPSCTVSIESKQGLREPVVSFAKPHRISITVSSRTSTSESEVKRLERSISAATIVSLAFEGAQTFVRTGAVPETHRTLLHTLAATYSGVDPDRAPKSVVGEVLTDLLKEPAQDSRGKSKRLPPNPLREDLAYRLKRFHSNLRGRIDCSTLAQAEKTVHATFSNIAAAKAASDLLGERKECEKAINGAVEELCGELCDQFARSLTLSEHETCAALLEHLKTVHAELACGGYHRPIPFMIARREGGVPLGKIIGSTTNLAQQLRDSMRNLPVGIDGALALGATAPLAPFVRLSSEFDAATTAAIIREMSAILALDQELQLEVQASQNDAIDHIVSIQVLSPGLAKTLLAIRSGDELADHTVLQELLKAVLALRSDVAGNGVWYHDLVLGGRDIPPPDRRNPEANAADRARTVVSTMKFLRNWQNPTDTTRAELLKENEAFIGLLVASSARAAVLAYESSCLVALQGGDSAILDGADFISDDLDTLEANLPYIQQCTPVQYGPEKIRKILQDAIDSVRQALKQLAQLRLTEDELVKQGADVGGTIVPGPLQKTLQEANEKIRERVDRYVEGLTKDAEEILEQLFLQDSAAGLVAHSVRLLDAVRLDPDKSEHQALVSTIEAKIREFINVVDEGCKREIKQAEESTQSLEETQGSSLENAKESSGPAIIEDVERGLQALHLLVSELRRIRDGLHSYQDLLVPPSHQSSTGGLVRESSIDELASLLIDQHTKNLSRALRSQTKVLSDLSDKVILDLSSRDAKVRGEAEQTRAGLVHLRLPRAMMSRLEGSTGHKTGRH